MDKHSSKRIEILGVPVDCVTMPEALDVVDQLVSDGAQGTAIAVNPEKIIKAQTDSELQGHLANAALLIPDGIGVVMAARLLGLGRMERVAGADLMPEICGRAAERGYSVYLYGASQDVNDKACKVLQQRYPSLRIAGSSNGFRKDEDMLGLIDEINASGASVLFIALGSPRQELWMARYLHSTSINVCQGVGGTFDVLAGNVRRAPALWRKLNLEWAYRLLSQPSRLLRQTALPRFAWRVFREWLAGSKPA